MVEAKAKGSWFTYFPENYRWSGAICGLLSSAPWGGAELGEVDQVGRRVRGQVGDDEAWFAAWCWMGDRVHALAEREEALGHRLTAAVAYLRACCYYEAGERFRTPKDEVGLEVYRRAIDCFKRCASLTDRPRIELVEIPYEGGHLPGYLVHAESTTLTRPPCVVFFDGLDGTKEMEYVRGVPDLVRRGLSCLLVDGPGSGESIRFRGFPLRYDYDVAGSAALDYLETRDDVDAQRVGVMALSAGGYYAPRCASVDKRFKACVAWGAIWDYHATWKQRIEAARSGGELATHAVRDQHIIWIFQVSTFEEALQKLEKVKLDGVVQQMECPFLLTHGEDDAQIPLTDAHALFNAVGSRDKTFKVFTVEEGGAQHCQRDNVTLGTTYIFDWLAEKL